MWYLLLIHAITSTNFILGKAVVSCAQPILSIGIRMLGCGSLLLFYSLLRYGRISMPWRHWWLLAQIAFFQIYISFAFEFWVAPAISSWKWAFMYGLSPFISAVFSYLTLKEPITRIMAIGFIIGLSGFIPIIIEPSSTEQMWGQWISISIPELMIAFSVAAFSYGWVVARELMKDQTYPVTMVTGISMFVGSILLCATSPFLDCWDKPLVNDYSLFAILTAAAIIANIFDFTMNTWLLRFHTATLLLFFMFVDPLYTALYGWFFLHETVGIRFFISLLLVSIGLYLFYIEEVRLEKAEISQH
jgi:drug/metabolite transporter (DMT)-like permease